MAVEYSIETHKGFVRANNEDFASIECVYPESGIDGGFLIAALADGVGGMHDGEVASEEAVKFFMHFEKDAVESGNFLPDVLSSIRKGMLKANELVLNINKGRKHSQYMATTLSSFIMYSGQIVLSNSGDSEIIVFDGELRTLSRIHREPVSGYLTSCIGVDKAPDIFTRHLALQNGNIILMCSDGLTDMLNYAEISAILNQPSKTSGELMGELRDNALANGGRDNITVIICKIKKK